MDVSKFQLTGEWLEIEVEINKKIKTLKFLVKPLSASGTIDFGLLGIGKIDKIKQLFTKVNDLVLNWDLKKDGQPLECTEDTKKQYLPYLVSMKVKNEKEGEQNEEEKEKRDLMTEKLEDVKDALLSEDTEKTEKILAEIEELKKEQKDPGQIVGGKILEFARDFSNFIKN